MSIKDLEKLVKESEEIRNGDFSSILGRTFTVEEAELEYYKTHTCNSDDPDLEQGKVEQWAEEMGYEITD